MSFILEETEYKSFLAGIPDILLICYGGSHAYGTDTPSSDIDLRGFYRNPVDELLGTRPDSEQVVDSNTDTTIYSMKKIFKLFTSCNPNSIELLGCRDEDYLLLTEEGRLILDEREIFLSKKAIASFGEYASSQLNRLINKSGRGKAELIQNESRSLTKAAAHLEDRYHKGNVRIKINVKDEQLFLDLDAKDMSMEQMIIVLNELNTVHKDYTKSRRNDKAVAHNKLNKHMMHLLRLYMMGLDILERHEIVTYREKEHDLLMDIRNGKYLEEDLTTPTKEFTELLDEYIKRFNEAAKNTTLPDEPDYEEINRLSVRINRMM